MKKENPVKKVLVIYYSRTGITKQVAHDIARNLDDKVAVVHEEELIDRKDRSGKIGYAIAGKDALMGKLTDIDEVVNHPKDYDLIVLGTPVWAATVAPAVRTYLDRYGANIGKACFYCTHGGGGASKTFRVMEDLAGCAPEVVVSIYDKDVKAKEHHDSVESFVDGMLENL